MKFEVAAITDVGLKREINQDSILVDHDLGLFVVADGMGGHRGGEVASALAIEAIQNYVKEHSEEVKSQPKQVLVEAYRDASARIHHKSTVESPDLMGMGTTMVAILLGRDSIYIANVGDSRAYLYRDPLIWQLTEDHSLINEQVRAGVIGEEEAPHVLGRNVITRSVGFEREVHADTLEKKIEAPETYLLCSDGLCGLVENEKLAEICRKGSPKEIAQRCVTEAKKAGGDDNVSVIVIRVSNSA